MVREIGIPLYFKQLKNLLRKLLSMSLGFNINSEFQRKRDVNFPRKTSILVPWNNDLKI